MHRPGPQFVQFFAPVLEALHQLGGSGRAGEVTDRVAANLQLSDAEQNERLESGSSRFRNRVAWARFYLAKAGLIDSSRHGVWALTEKGSATKSLSHQEALDLFAQVRELMSDVESDQESDGADPDVVATPVEPTPTVAKKSYRERLAERLQGMPASAFERFSQRLLREAGFEQVTVTGRSGDGGIDGIGLLQVNPLVSFKVLFQCKRYTGSVTPGHVRDFRGAMQGRADKGIVITTGTFTAEARKEAVRDGVPPIELVDGEKLLDMCQQLELGLRRIETFELDDQFFADFV